MLSPNQPMRQGAAQQMDIIVSALLPLAVIIIMFCLGLTPADFQRIWQRPRAALVGDLNQIILLPLAALTIILVFGFEKETAVGFMIQPACLGGAVSNIITRVANWDVALSVTLTATFSLTCVVSIPLILDLAMRQFMVQAAPEIDILVTALTAFVLTTLPISVGVALRAMAPLKAVRIEPVLSRAAALLFAIIILAAIASNWPIVTSNIAELGFGLLALILLLSAIGLLGAPLLGSSAVEARTITIETGVQNGALGISVAALLLPGEGVFNAYAIRSALYSVVWLGAVLSFLGVMHVMKAKRL